MAEFGRKNRFTRDEVIAEIFREDEMGDSEDSEALEDRVDSQTEKKEKIRLWLESLSLNETDFLRHEFFKEQAVEVLLPLVNQASCLEEKDVLHTNGKSSVLILLFDF